MQSPVIPADMKRVQIVGSTGSGKSTLARSLAAVLDAKHIELAAFRYLARWQVRPFEETRALVAMETRAERWTIGSNAGHMRDITLQLADTVIFLDYPLPVILWRLTTRTLRHTITRENLWGTGSRENFVRHLRWNDNSLFYSAIDFHRHRRDRLLKRLHTEFASLRLCHFTSPRQTSSWLNAVRTACAQPPA